MKPIQFEGVNANLGKPEGMTDAECGSLPVYHGKDDKGRPFVNSMWQPSEADKKAIAEGRPVMLSISTPLTQVPLMSVFTYDENGQLNPQE